MSQTIDAIIDTQGQIRLFEKIKLDKKHRAKVIILDEGESFDSDYSTVGSMELVDGDLETASREIAAFLNESLAKSVEDLKK